MWFQSPSREEGDVVFPTMDAPRKRRQIQEIHATYGPEYLNSDIRNHLSKHLPEKIEEVARRPDYNTALVIRKGSRGVALGQPHS